MSFNSAPGLNNSPDQKEKPSGMEVEEVDPMKMSDQELKTLGLYREGDHVVPIEQFETNVQNEWRDSISDMTSQMVEGADIESQN